MTLLVSLYPPIEPHMVYRLSFQLPQNLTSTSIYVYLKMYTLTTGPKEPYTPNNSLRQQPIPAISLGAVGSDHGEIAGDFHCRLKLARLIASSSRAQFQGSRILREICKSKAQPVRNYLPTKKQ